MEAISSPHNPRVKRARRLRLRRGRNQLQRILIEGAREVLRACEAGVPIEELFFAPHGTAAAGPADALQAALKAAGWDAEAARDAARLLCGNGAQLLLCSDAVLERMAYRGAAAGLVAVARPATMSLDSLRLPATPLVAVLESIEKPGNLGAVLRTADGAGVDAVVVADPATDVFNPNCIRASLGTVFSRPVCQASAHETLKWLRAAGMQLLAARVDGVLDYWSADLTRPAALILGSEAEGLSDVWREPDVQALRLPMCGQVDSLNVSTAAAVLFYEALRQRQHKARQQGD